MGPSLRQRKRRAAVVVRRRSGAHQPQWVSHGVETATLAVTAIVATVGGGGGGGTSGAGVVSFTIIILCQIGSAYVR